MYCKKCGNPNDDDAVYCKKCGSLMEFEDETRVVRRTPPDFERSDPSQIYRIGPTLKFIKLGYILSALGAVVLVVLLSMLGVSPWISVLASFLLFLIPGYFHLLQRMVSYSLNSQFIEVDSGLISRTTRNIPLSRVQDVTVSAGMMQRMLNFGNVVIDNASEDGGKVIIKNIDSPREYADRLLRNMRRLER